MCCPNIRRSSPGAVIARGGRINHPLHFVLGLVTCSAWWFVWLAIVVFGGKIERKTVTVDDAGHIGV